MGANRSKGVTIFSWLIIIGSAFGLLAVGVYLKLGAIVAFLLYLAIGVISLITAANLLKLKKWARISIIVISVIVAVETLVTLPAAIEQSQAVVEEQFDVAFEETIQTTTQDGQPVEIDELRMEELKVTGKDTANKMAARLVIILSLLSVIFNAAVIYFFAHPKIKAQFV